jgi:hypothetical protein
VPSTASSAVSRPCACCHVWAPSLHACEDHCMKFHDHARHGKVSAILFQTRCGPALPPLGPRTLRPLTAGSRALRIASRTVTNWSKLRRNATCESLHVKTHPPLYLASATGPRVHHEGNIILATTVAPLQLSPLPALVLTMITIRSSTTATTNDTTTSMTSSQQYVQ